MSDLDETTDYIVPLAVISALYFISFLMMVILTALVTKSDPTDPTISLERLSRTATKYGLEKVEFNPSDYQFYCDVCDTHVLKNTKHC